MFIPGKSTGVGCHFLLQGIEPGSPTFDPNSGIEPGSPTFQTDALTSEAPGKPISLSPFFWGVGQEYWSGLPFPSPGDFPDPGIEPRSPALLADALPSEPPGKSQFN